MSDKLLELARAVVEAEFPKQYTVGLCDFCNYYADDGHADDCEWLLLKNEVQRVGNEVIRACFNCDHYKKKGDNDYGICKNNDSPVQAGMPDGVWRTIDHNYWCSEYRK